MMKICIPIDAEQGLQSPICQHFGAAPTFLVVDTEDQSFRAVPNARQHQGHGRCTPLDALEGLGLGGMVVAGIGRGALNKLSAAQIPVYLSSHATVAEALDALAAGSLSPMTPSMACTQHRGGHGHQCGHHA